MKSIYAVITILLTLSSVHAEDIKVYPQGVTEKHNVKKKAMLAPTHNWSNTDKEKKHKTRQEVRDNGDIKQIRKHKRRPSKSYIRTERIKF